MRLERTTSRAERFEFDNAVSLRQIVTSSVWRFEDSCGKAGQAKTSTAPRTPVAGVSGGGCKKMYYVFVPFSLPLEKIPDQFARDIKKMNAIAVTPLAGTLKSLTTDDKLAIMGHCGPGLDMLYSAPTNLCMEVGVELLVKRLVKCGLPRNWQEIVLIACCAAGDPSAKGYAQSFASKLETTLHGNESGIEFKAAKVKASMYEVAIIAGKPVERGRGPGGQMVQGDFVNHRAPLTPIPHQSGARPGPSGPARGRRPVR